MSCGRPHATPCELVLAHLLEFLESTLDAATSAQITSHLDECPPCVDHMPGDVEVQTLVARGCCNEKAPDAVRVRIETQVRQWCAGDVTVTYSELRASIRREV